MNQTHIICWPLLHTLATDLCRHFFLLVLVGEDNRLLKEYLLDLCKGFYIVEGRLGKLEIRREDEIRKGSPRFRTLDMIVLSRLCRNVEVTWEIKRTHLYLYRRHNGYDELGLLEKIDNFLCLRFSSTIKSSDSKIIFAVFISSIS